MYRKLVLLAASLVLLLVLFKLPTYSYWLKNNMLISDAVIEQSEHMSLEDRRMIRYGGTYGMYMQIAAALKKEGIKDPVILLPPDDCVRKITGLKDLHIDEPLVFYYYTGLKAVTARSYDVLRANCTLLPVKGAPLVVGKVLSPQHLQSIIAEYKKYKLN